MKSDKKNLGSLSNISKWKLLTLLTVGISLLVTTVVAFIVDPVLVLARYKLRLGKGTVVYEMLTKELEGALIEAYVFNVTNADKFISGEDYKLKLQEIGPFTYQEYRSHDNLFLDEKAGIMRYTPRLKTRFHPERSITDPKDVNVLVPNIPFLALASKISNYPYWTKLGLNLLASRLDSKPVINLTVHDFLWSYNDSLIALGNTLIPGMINFKTLGLLDRLYDQNAEYNLELGASNEDKFRIRSVNGQSGLGIWGHGSPIKRTRCNSFVDTYEGLAYPPGLTPKTPLRMYRNVFCRIIDLQYNGTRDMEYGPKALVYRFSNTTFVSGPETECLCSKFGCYDGMSDLSPCFYGFNVYLSQAHFLDVNPKLYERLEGIHPNFTNHGSEFILDPNLGTVLRTTCTLQLNVILKDVDYNIRSKPFSNMVLPVLYFKIVQPELPDETKDVFRTMYFVLPYVFLGIEATLLIIAVILLTYSCRCIYRNWRVSKKGRPFTITTDRKPVPGAVGEPLIKNNANFITDMINETNLEKSVH